MPASCCRNPLQMKRPRGVEPECIGPHDPPSTDAQKTTDVSSVSVALTGLWVEPRFTSGVNDRIHCALVRQAGAVAAAGRCAILGDFGTFCGLGCPLGKFLTVLPPSGTLTSSGQLVLARQAPWERLGGGTTFCGPPGWPLSCPSWSPMSPSGRATAVVAVQDILGDHQDTVVAEAWLRNTGAALPPACVAAGALVTSVRLEQARPRSDRPKAWKRASARKLRRWLRKDRHHTEAPQSIPAAPPAGQPSQGPGRSPHIIESASWLRQEGGGFQLQPFW